jgi:hypothetical protein
MKNTKTLDENRLFLQVRERKHSKDEDLKLIASSIAKKPLVQRYVEILTLLKDLDKHITQENTEKTSYVI